MEESSINENKQTAALNPYASNINYKTGYENVDNLTNQSNSLINNSLNAQIQSIDTSTQTNINELQRKRDEASQDVNKQNKAYYQEYQKAINPYGVQAEALAARGLRNAGIAETTKTNIYNQYQKSVTESLNNLQRVSADYDVQMAQVRSNADVAKAEAISNMYLQQLESIKYAYSLAEAQKEFEYNKSVNDRNYNYQIERDRVSDDQWRQQFEYQKQRDAVSDNQWRQQFEAVKKSSSSSGTRSTGKSKNSSTGSLTVGETSINSSSNGEMPDILKKILMGGYVGANAIASGMKVLTSKK